MSLNAALRDFGVAGVSESCSDASALRDTLLEHHARIPSPDRRREGAVRSRRRRCSRAALGKPAVTRFRDSLVVRVREKPGAPKVALVGHLDVVRTQHDGPARIEGDAPVRRRARPT